MTVARSPRGGRATVLSGGPAAAPRRLGDCCTRLREVSVELVDLGRMELAYSSLEAVEYEVGAQFYGVMEGTLVGDRLSGTLHLTNLAQGRPDGVNTPTLRGL